MRANLVASCSDAGIYVNRGAASRILDNTLLDTAGVQVRFADSSARIDGNLVDGGLVARDGGRLDLGQNRVTPIALTYLGYHPQRRLFADPATLDLRWKDEASRRAGAAAGPDLCGAARPASAAYGAFEDFTACLQR